MVVEVNTVKGVEVGKPKLLFNLGPSIPFNPAMVNISPDGERFLVSLPPKKQLREMTVFDRQGKILNKIGEPGGFVKPHLSPDGSRVVVMRNDPKTDQNENGKLQLYVRPFDAAKPENPPPGTLVQVSPDVYHDDRLAPGRQGMYFLQPDAQNADVHVMAVEVTTTPAFKPGTPKELFRLPSTRKFSPGEERLERRPAVRVLDQCSGPVRRPQCRIVV